MCLLFNLKVISVRQLDLIVSLCHSHAKISIMKVIIIGAGIGGLSAGIGLRRAGHEVLVGALVICGLQTVLIP